MYLVVIAWGYVVIMMAVAEATSPQGTLLGALITFVLYGALPLTIVMYLLGTPARRRARLTEQRSALAAQPDDGGHPAGEAITPIRKEP